LKKGGQGYQLAAKWGEGRRKKKIGESERKILGNNNQAKEIRY